MEHLTLDSFKDKICECGLDSGEAKWEYKGSLPCIIDFYADWCGPCKAIAPILEQISKEYKGKLEVYKVNTEQQQQLAGMFGIRSIPSLLFVPLSGKPQMAAGALPKPMLERSIQEILGVTK
jgi:thioredoxin